MNTALAPTPEAATLNKFRSANAQSIDDRTRRFGYSGGVPNMSIPPKVSGLPSATVTGGTLLLYAPFVEATVGAYDAMRKKYPRITRVVTPWEQSTNVRRRFYESDDMGYRDLNSLTKLPYEVTDAGYTDEAPQYFDTIHVKLSCEYGLESIFVSGAEGNVGAEHYQACPTCRLADLRSRECDRRIAESPLDTETLEALRNELIAANEAAIRFAHRRIDLVNADLEKRSRGENGRSSRNEVDYLYLKMVHQDAPAQVKPMNMQDIVAGAATAAATAAVQATQGQQVAPVQTGFTIPDDEKENYLKFKASQERMAKAREAKNAANDSSEDESNN